MNFGAHGFAFAFALALMASPTLAQRPVTPAPRLALMLGSDLSPRPAPYGGVALDFRAGWYARIGIAAEAGLVPEGQGWMGSRRLSASARFLLDPFGQRRFGLYGGAGVALHDVVGARAQGRLFMLVGIEGDPFAHAMVPAFELSVGGGARAALVLRPRRRDSR